MSYLFTSQGVAPPLEAKRVYFFDQTDSQLNSIYENLISNGSAYRLGGIDDATAKANADGGGVIISITVTDAIPVNRPFGQQMSHCTFTRTATS
jgi:hypothetical protein